MVLADAFRIEESREIWKSREFENKRELIEKRKIDRAMNEWMEWMNEQMNEWMNVTHQTWIKTTTIWHYSTSKVYIIHSKCYICLLYLVHQKLHPLTPFLSFTA